MANSVQMCIFLFFITSFRGDFYDAILDEINTKLPFFFVNLKKYSYTIAMKTHSVKKEWKRSIDKL